MCSSLYGVSGFPLCSAASSDELPKLLKAQPAPGFALQPPSLRGSLISSAQVAFRRLPEFRSYLGESVETSLVKRFDKSAPLVPPQTGRRGNSVLLLTLGGLTASGLLIAMLAARSSGKKLAQRVPKPSTQPPRAPIPAPADVPLGAPWKVPTPAPVTTPPPLRVSSPPPPIPEPPRQTQAPGTSVIFAPHVVLSGWGAGMDAPSLGELWAQPEPERPPLLTPSNTGIVGPAVEPYKPLTGDAAPGDPLVPDLQPAQYTDAWLRAYTEGYTYGKTLKPAEAHRKIVSLAFFKGQRAGALGFASEPPAAGPDRKDYLDGYALGRETDKTQLLEIVRGEASAMGSFDAVRGLTPRTEPAHSRV